MAQKALREFSGKRLIQNWLIKHGAEKEYLTISDMFLVRPDTDLDKTENPFDENMRLVIKPDQLVKRRGNLGLVQLNKTWKESLEYLSKIRGRKLVIGQSTDYLNYFLVEPFIVHKQEEEHYVCIRSTRDYDEILFYHEGGVNVGNVDNKASRLQLKLTEELPLSTDKITKNLLSGIKDTKRQLFIAKFISYLYSCFCELHFTYLEINPIVVNQDLTGLYILDLAGKLDSTAEFQCHNAWSDIVDFPPPFGHQQSKEEAFIEELDERTGASLKLTILNPKGRVWTMVAGGGASVIYADTVADLGFADELGNYGEYSGAPTQSLTYQYATTIIKLCTKYPNPKGKVLLIGGGIANFTDVADTFKGIIQALTENKKILQETKTRIFVRRGGPNYQTGLKLMRECGLKNQLDMEVYGPESHITAIVRMALLNTKRKPQSNSTSTVNNSLLSPTSQNIEINKEMEEEKQLHEINIEARISNVDLKKYKWNTEWETKENENAYVMRTNTKAIVYGMQVKAVQNMLDFDYISRRNVPSVAGIVYTFSSGMYHRQFYWGQKEIMVPVYQSLKDALSKHKDVDTIVNFASSRSAYPATLDMLKFSQIRHITIIAEGVPERYTRDLIRRSEENNITILGPSTVGGLKPGSFRIGNTGGMLDNIVSCKLYRPGCVGFVSKSGGLSNELSNIINRNADGVLEGMAIGGDRYPCSTFMTNLLRYQRDPNCKILVVLGEVGGTLEYEVGNAIKKGIITKPVIAWCTGTCAKCFKHEVQFGHAGALAQSNLETAAAKNKMLQESGALVPESFDDFSLLIKYMYQRLLNEGIVKKINEIEPPPIPVDFHWAKKLGMVRKPSSFLSGISDERGEELVYAGMPISQIFKQDLGIGGVVGLLWFRRRLPDYCNKFIEIILMTTADHGPAVSGAHNTIVTARAGKDLISSLCSGLLTIGPRFGGALDGAARMFTKAYDDMLSPEEFVKTTRKSGKLILGIGHKVKSLENPDKRVEIIVEFVKKNFPTHPVLDYALKVQKVTTRKKSNLILNVDGAIACAFVDLLRGCKAFSKQEAQQYIQMGSLNALFVLGRSIGFIGHFLDQKRLGQGLYRHPTDDITYFLNDLQDNTNQDM